MKKLVFMFFCLLILNACKKQDPQHSYTIQMTVTGSHLTQIYCRSGQNNFDVVNVPTNHWSAGTQWNGDDTLHLTGVQWTDSITPVVVSMVVDQFDGPTITYKDSDATSKTLDVVLPK